MADIAGVIARPYIHDDPERFHYIVEQCCEHRPWFDDYTWEDPALKRTAVIGYLVDAFSNGRLWEVFDGGKLANKRMLCLNGMRWAFGHLDLHRLSIEVPTYARALANFARKKLGFRYEAESRSFSWPQNAKALTVRLAELGSRKHQATLYKGSWHDVLLLSITNEEFDDFVRSLPQGSTADSPTAGLGTAHDQPDQGVPGESAGLSSTDAPDEQAATEPGEHVQPAARRERADETD
jgi:hypothetical protein